MSSLPSVASPTSIETQLPGSTAFLNTSSAATGGPDVSPLPSSSVIFSDSAQDILTSSNDAPNVAPSTTHSPPTQAPSTTGSSFSAEETVGSFSTTAVPDRNSTANDEPALPTTITASNQPGSSAPAQTPSSTKEPSPQIVPLPTASASEAPTVTPSSPTPSSATIPSQSSGVGTEIAQEVSSTPANPTSTTRTQATSAAAQPTDDSTQEPEVFSAEAVDPPAKTSALSSNPAASSAEAPPSAVATSSTIATSSSPPRGAKANSSNQEQPPAAPTGAVNQVVSVSAASSSASTTSISATTSTPIPTSISVSTSTSGSAAIFAALSATTSTPVSVTSVPLSDSISSGTSSSTATDATFSTTGSAGGIVAFPSAISTLPGDASESSSSAGSQSTGQPIVDPVGSSSKPPTGTIVGGTVGGIAAVALILILLWLWKRRAADGRQGLNKDGGFTEKGSFISMGQKLGISTTLNAARRKLGEKLGSRNVNMDRGNSQFLEAAITEPINATLPPDPLCQHPVAPGNRPREFRNGQGISLEPGKLNPFSDANSLMSVTAPPPSSLDPFSDDNMVLPPPVSASTRRSRGRSLGGLGSFQVPRGPPRPHSVHRESVHGLESTGQNRESFLQRRDRIRSDPFDLELQPNQLIPPGTAISTRGSSVYSGQFQQSSRDSYTSRYVSGSSLGDWSGGVKEEPVGYEGMVERVDSPTIA